MGSRSQHYLSHLYLGPEARAEEDRVLAAVREKRPLLGLYLITLSYKETEQLEIVPSYLLKERSIRDKLPCIVGAAKGRSEAFSLVETMVADAYRETGKVRLPDYLLQKEAGGAGL